MSKIPLTSFSWPTLMFIVWLCSGLYTYEIVSSQCLDDQKSLLLELKTDLEFDTSYPSDKLLGWNQSKDCCQWRGVECKSGGQVIGLDLSNQGITSGIDDSSCLFRLEFLQRLNLAVNYEIQGEIPSSIGKLTSLTHLNLSRAGFSGQVPVQISQLVKLVVLDISNEQLYMPNLSTITQNLTNIRELYLDYVQISVNGEKWCEELSSSLPHLQVLSMRGCNLRGEIHKSLLKLHHLSVICLSSNSLASQVPEFLAEFTNLTTLVLSNCDLTGKVPRKIFLIPTLRTLDLSANNKLKGSLPVFYKNGSLEELILGATSFSGLLPSSISNLNSLRRIDLSRCNFQGSIPSSIGGLSLLEEVDLSANAFSGPIPSFTSAKNLKFLVLGSNNLNGSIIDTKWGNLNNLREIDLSRNFLDGSIPTSLFLLPSLWFMYLQENRFNGELSEFGYKNYSSMLDTLDLSNNDLQGPVPKSLFLLRELTTLDLSLNKFNGSIKLAELLHSLRLIHTLDLSHNLFSVNTDGCDSSFPQLVILRLASCNLHNLPEFLKNQIRLYDLDLSMNHISGTLPRWLWGISDKNPLLISFNLSFNHLVDMEPPLALPNSNLMLDLQSNKLQGLFPAILSILKVLDCSNNNFTSIDPEIGNYLSNTSFLSFSKNNIRGNIPAALCNATDLRYLNLEYNQLSGRIPDCLIAMTQLTFLNLRGNRLRGTIPAKFRKGCSLETLNLNMNFLQGRVPKSLANCAPLKMLDLGNNQLDDAFPCHLKSLNSLKVLVLRSNKFRGTINCPMKWSMWPMLQIVDLAFNHFIGELKAQLFLKWTSMMDETSAAPSESDYITSGFYQNSVTLTFKGATYELQYILTVFVTIDFSNNAFHGEVPNELGNLNALKVLNLSHNSFSGNIPTSIGNLSQIESLDLSCNSFSGIIPAQLSDLNFLEYLNMSFNKLSGKIPTSTQLQSFDMSSYEGPRITWPTIDTV